MWTSPDRWTCPHCGGTETTGAPTAERRQRAIATSQRQHARDHADDLAVAARHGITAPSTPALSRSRP